MVKDTLGQVLFVALLILCVFLLTLFAAWAYTPETDQELTIAADGQSEYLIAVESSGSEDAAAAEYLANTILARTGARVGVETQQRGEDRYEGKYIVIRTAPGEAGEDAGPYSIELTQDDVIITVYEQGREFAAVKAISDRWVREDCGLLSEGTLTLSPSMIEEQLCGLSLELEGQLKILTQNLRQGDDPNGNSIEERAPRFLRLVDENQPDLIGTQETSVAWMSFLRENLSDTYAIYGYSREGRRVRAGEWNAILYRKDRFVFQAGDTFWLSETPEVQATMLDYVGNKRICTWVQLKDKETGKSFVFCNTHLQNGRTDQFGEIRTRQLQVLLDVLRSGSDYLDSSPCFLVGDFNAAPGEGVYDLASSVLRDAEFSALKDSSTIHYTYHQYGERKKLLDYCFHSGGNTTVLDYRILNSLYGGYVSDHFGILVTAIVN